MKIKKSELSKIIAEIVAEELAEVNHTQTTAGKWVPAVGAPNSIARFAVEHPEIIQQMKEWVKDCQWRDVCEPDEVDELSDVEVLQGVERHYQGGIQQFVKDSKPKQTQEGCGGAGYVYDKDMKKDPKHIAGERWRIRFNSPSDIKKHGKSEKLTTETISRKEIKAVIKELINEMWVGFEEEGKVNESPQVPPEGPLPKNAQEIANLIFSLKEGEYIWFCFDKTGRDGHGFGVQKKVEGDDYVLRTTGQGAEYLEEDEDVLHLAEGIIVDPYLHYYFIKPIQGYKKKPYEGDPDHDIGDYEINGPDRPRPEV